MNMRRFLASVVTTTIACSGMMIAAPAQAAGSPGCMTRSEFNSIHRGFSLPQIQRLLGQPGTYAGGGASAWQYIFSECWNRGAQAEFAFSVDGPYPPYRTHLYAKSWDRDLPSPGGVSLYEFGMMGEWLQIGRHPTRAVVEHLFEARGHVAEGGDLYYPVVRVSEWDRRFGNRAGTYTVYVRYRNGHMIHVEFLRTVG